MYSVVLTIKYFQKCRQVEQPILTFLITNRSGLTLVNLAFQLNAINYCLLQRLTHSMQHQY